MSKLNSSHMGPMYIEAPCILSPQYMALGNQKVS